MPREKETRSYNGSVFKRTVRKEGRKTTVWDVRKRYFDPSTEKYRDKTQRCYSAAEAQIALTNLTTEAESVREPVRQRLSDLITYFRAEYVKPAVFTDNVQISGYRQDLKTVGRYLDEIETFFKDPYLTEINYEHCRAFRDHLATTLTRNGNLPAASTYHKKLSILSKLFTVGVQLRWLERSPMTLGESLIRKSAERKRQRMMTFEEEQRLLAQCTGERAHLAAFVIASVDTGMRRGEIYDLRWWQIDFEQQVIYLTEEAAKGSKTGVEGILPLTDRLAKVFGEIYAARVYASRTDVDSNDLVLGRCEFKRSWATACRLAKIDGLQFKDLRRTGSTRMMLAGNAGPMVQKITRHTKPETLLDIYTAVDVTNAREVGRKLQKFNEKQGNKVKAKVEAKNKASDE